MMFLTVNAAVLQGIIPVITPSVATTSEERSNVGLGGPIWE